MKPIQLNIPADLDEEFRESCNLADVSYDCFAEFEHGNGYWVTYKDPSDLFFIGLRTGLNYSASEIEKLKK